MPETACVLCGASIPEGRGNNPAPLATSGVCCDACNITRVIPARILVHATSQKSDHAKQVSDNKE